MFSAPVSHDTSAMLDRSGNLLCSNNPAMQRVLALAQGVARTPTTVLLSGESGTGKEVMARHIHQLSSRSEQPFVAVNCAAIPSTLMESEIFGHEKGAFSGAGERKPGKFELAQNGTLLLDEVSELPLELQAKLLRVLQEQQVTRVGGTRTIELNVRVIATTNRNLTEMVADGSFRQDLFYRINVFPIQLVPLRNRLVDLPALSRTIVTRLTRRLGRSALRIDDSAMSALMRHTFPGNVRELQNVLERAVVLTYEGAITRDILMFDAGVQAAPQAPVAEMNDSFGGKTLAEVERQVILGTLRKLAGNRTRTSEVLGISIRTLRNRLREYRTAGFEVMSNLGVAA